jgi:alkylation response protein AidB-like acyl-CoA dehydrogenase
MDFDLSDEQRMLEDGLRRFIKERYDLKARRTSIESAAGFSHDVWKAFAELGWLGVALPEDAGGLGGGPVDLMVVMERLGYGLVVEPYLASVVLAGGLLARTGDSARLLPKLAAGELQLAAAIAEPQARFDLHDVTTRGDRIGEGWRLNGAKTLVLNAPSADWLVVTARTADGQRDPSGLSLFLVPATTPGVEIRPVRTQDDFAVGEVRLIDAIVDKDSLLGAEGGALAGLQQVVDSAMMADAAYALGCMEFLVATTADYLKTRKQFGKPLASFQVLQHRLVQMHVALEEARSLVIGGTLALDEDDALERQGAVSAAKIQINQAARLIGQEAIQMHGGIGMTDALIVGNYYKRLLAVSTLFGDTDHHLGLLADRIAA